MKKEYVAPDLHFESFVLSQSIAAGCSSDAIGVIKSWMKMDSTLFISNTPSNYLNHTCTTDYYGAGGEWYCYWDGSDSEKLFLS